MFYSHEILTSQQHGVATIWLLATIGPRGSNRKLTRKAIQEVDVKGACQKFIEPGAPLALRLQGNLLYGVSRVYSQQCNYVLTDAEKVQHDMMLFYRLVAQNATDPDAGKARREQNILSDDPNFMPESQIPHFDFDADGNTFVQASQSSSRMVYSQLSPSDIMSSAARTGSLMEFDFSQSEGDAASFFLPTPAKARHTARNINLPEAMIDPVQDQLDDLGFMGLDMEIAPDGTILGFADDLDLPPLPFAARDIEINFGNDLQNEDGDVVGLQQPLPTVDAEGDIRMMDDPPLLEPDEIHDINQPTVVATNSPLHRRVPRGRRPHNISPDSATNFTTGILAVWKRDYLQLNKDRVKESWPPKVTRGEARNNAFSVMFGQGLGGVGLPNGVPDFTHPLAELFAGSALRAQILDLQCAEEFASEDGSRSGGRRSASKAFGEDEDQEGPRRVRPRLEHETPQPRIDPDPHGRHDAVGEMGQLFDEQHFTPEAAREHQDGLDDRLSSSLMPWNRTPSVHHPSSIAGSKKNVPGSRQATGSPKDVDIQLIERYSDAPGAPSSNIGFSPLPPMQSDFEEYGPAALVTTQQAEDSQWMYSALDTASHEFLDYMKEQAKRTGGLLEGDLKDRLWIEFEELAAPDKHTKIVAAQAFLHVLTLGTKNIIKIDQDVVNNQPFGTIHIGTMVAMETETVDSVLGEEGDSVTGV